MCKESAVFEREGESSVEASKQFSEFYKEIHSNEIVDDDNTRPEFPRAMHDNIDNFKYHTVESFNTEIKTEEKSKLSVLNINIRGIDCNFENFLNYISTIEHNFDVLILTEAHIQVDPHYNADLHQKHVISGYDKFYCRYNIKFGGVVIYVKTEYQACYISELTKTILLRHMILYT